VSGLNVKPSSPTSTLWVLFDAEAVVLDDALVVLLASFDPYWALVNGSAKRRKIIAAIIVAVKGMLIFLRFQKYNGYRTMGTHFISNITSTPRGYYSIPNSE
jgi:hypothetical protein